MISHFRALSLLVAFTSFGAIAPSTSFADDSNKVTPEIKQAVLDGLHDVLNRFAYVPGIDFKKWPEFFAKQKADVDKAPNAKDFVAAVNKALKEFGVSHIVLATPQAAEARRQRKSVGIGISIEKEDRGIRITRLFEGAPAFRAGLNVGDLIIAVDGKKPDDSASMQGDEGSKVTITVERTDGRTKDYTLVREKFSNVRPETLTWPDKETAVLKITSFDISYNRKNVNQFMKDAANAKRLILDLRSNGGGAVLNLIHLLGYFMPTDTPVGTFVGRAMVDKFVEDTHQEPLDVVKIAFWSDKKVKAGKVDVPVFKGKVAVLVNGGSGSASEIVAAALNEVLGAPIVGSRSAGAVLVSTMKDLAYGYQLQYPISDYVTIRGIRLEKNGVKPEVEAPLAKYGQKDEAIDKAIAILHRIELRDARYGLDTNSTK